MNLRMRHMRAIVRSVKLCIEQRKEDMNVINDIGELTASPTKAQLLHAIVSMSAYRHRLAIASGMRGHLPRALLDCAYARVIEIQTSMLRPLNDTVERHGELESAQNDLHATQEVALALEPQQFARDCATLGIPPLCNPAQPATHTVTSGHGEVESQYDVPTDHAADDNGHESTNDMAVRHKHSSMGSHESSGDGTVTHGDVLHSTLPAVLNTGHVPEHTRVVRHPKAQLKRDLMRLQRSVHDVDVRHYHRVNTDDGVHRHMAYGDPVTQAEADADYRLAIMDSGDGHTGWTGPEWLRACHGRVLQSDDPHDGIHRLESCPLWLKATASPTNVYIRGSERFRATDDWKNITPLEWGGVYDHDRLCWFLPASTSPSTLACALEIFAAIQMPAMTTIDKRGSTVPPDDSAPAARPTSVRLHANHNLLALVCMLCPVCTNAETMDTPLDAPIPTVVLIIVLAAAGFIAVREVCNAVTEKVALHTVSSRILWAGSGVLAMTTVACAHSERETVVAYACVGWSLTAVTLLCMFTTVVTMVLSSAERQYVWTQAHCISRTMYLWCLSPLLTVAWWLIMLRRITIIPVVVVIPIPGRTTGGRGIVRLWVVVRRTSRMGPFITATLL